MRVSIATIQPPMLRQAPLLLALCLSGGSALACQPVGPLRYVLSHIPSEIGGQDTIRRVEVGAEGCLWVHYPAWDRRAGDWSMQLSGGELAELEQRVQRVSTRHFDTAQLQQGKRQIDAQLQRAPDSRPALSWVAGASRHELQLAPGSEQARTLAWTALQHDAQRYEELPELAALWSAVEALMQLSEDARLQPLDRQGGQP